MGADASESGHQTEEQELSLGGVTLARGQFMWVGHGVLWLATLCVPMLLPKEPERTPLRWLLCAGF